MDTEEFYYPAGKRSCPGRNLSAATREITSEATAENQVVLTGNRTIERAARRLNEPTYTFFRRSCSLFDKPLELSYLT